MPRKSDIVRLNLRLTRDLYDRLVKSTQKNGTSLQTEVINRIEQTYGNHLPDGMVAAIKNAVMTTLVETGVKVLDVEVSQVTVTPPKSDDVGRPKSPIVKRSIVIAGHNTSVSLEDAFWKALQEIASGRNMTLSDIVATIDSERRHGNLSSAIRQFVLDHNRSAQNVGGHSAEPPVKKSA